MGSSLSSLAIYDLTPDDVTCGSFRGGRTGYIDILDNVTIRGTIAGLRAVAVEIDRQLARLEVEHRIDQAVTKCGTCDGAGEVVEVIGVCPDCWGTGQ